MINLLSYADLMEKQIEELYSEILMIEEDVYESSENNTDDGGSNSNLSQAAISKRYAAGAAIGAGIGTVGRYGLDAAIGSNKRDSLKTAANVKRVLPYAIGGAVLAATLGALYNIVKKKIAIKKLIASETNAEKKASLKKELNSLSAKEVINLKKYKSQETLAKLKAKTKLSSADEEKLKAQAKKGEEEKKKIDKLKQAISDTKSK